MLLLLFSTISKELVLKIAVLAAVGNFNYQNTIITINDFTVCEIPKEHKVIYIRENKKSIDIITVDGEFFNIKNGFYCIEQK